MFKHGDIQNTISLLIKSCTFRYIKRLLTSSCTFKNG